MSCKVKKSKNKNINKNFGDVTINDFANAKVCKNAGKKSANSLIHAMKQMEIDDRPWDEKIEDFEGDFDLVEEENEDGTTSVIMKRRKRKKANSEMEIDNKTGNEYPIDIWFLISEHIRPEDVCRFSGICRSTYTIVCSAKFWFNIYKRFYRNSPKLPKRLQPECMVRLYGLKACVVRALHIMYPPLINRVQFTRYLKEHPCNLLKRQCVLMWHSKRKENWQYSFKFKENLNQMLYFNKPKYPQPDLIEMLDDVLANTEEHCRILQVNCPHFIAIPLVVGLTLISHDTRSSSIILRFGSGLSYHNKSTDGANCIEIMLDPVINFRVLDWWHPLYPHSQTTPLLNQEDMNEIH